MVPDRALLPVLSAFFLLLCLSGVATAQGLNRLPQETARHFAIRVLGLPDNDEGPHVTETKWNGLLTIFVDFALGEEREVVALRRETDGTYRKLHVTTGEVEGGEAVVDAIGFANADRDGADELIVILSWPVWHQDVFGRLYEVRVFDDAKPGHVALVALKAVSRRFAGHECDCTWRDGKVQRFPFKTMAAVKRELKRLGF